MPPLTTLVASVSPLCSLSLSVTVCAVPCMEHPLCAASAAPMQSIFPAPWPQGIMHWFPWLVSICPIRLQLHKAGSQLSSCLYIAVLGTE